MAWTGDFTITNIYVAGENNFQYRIYGMVPNSSCSNGSNWVYINKSDSGSEGFVAAMFTAFASGRPIRALIEPTNGYCHVIELFMTS